MVTDGRTETVRAAAWAPLWWGPVGPSVHSERTFLEGFFQKNPIPKEKPHRKVLHCQLEPASGEKPAAHMQNEIGTGSSCEHAACCVGQMTPQWLAQSHGE